jgi:hypothetical protein
MQIIGTAEASALALEEVSVPRASLQDQLNALAMRTTQGHRTSQ